MALGVNTMLENGGSIKLAYELDLVASIKKSTLRSRYDKQVKIASEQNEAHELDDKGEDDLDLFDRNINKGEDKNEGKMITTESERAILQAIAVARDNNNKGMTRGEMIATISQLSECTRKQAEDHYDYLVRKKVLTKLKGGGRVVTAQATTTNRTAGSGELVRLP